MAQRLRLLDCRLSRLPAVVGLCSEDRSRVASYVNSAQRRLLYAVEAGNDGWWGTFAEVAFTVDPTSPYITLNRHVARVMYMNWCESPVPVENQFMEYLTFGDGRMPKTYERTHGPGLKTAYTRNNVICAVDFTAGRAVRVRYSDAADAAKTVIIQGTDTNDKKVYTRTTEQMVEGEQLTTESPFVTTTTRFNTLTGIQKDVTSGDVMIYSVDMVTGDETLLVTLEPGETTPNYRRYYLNELPNGCCGNGGTVQLHAIVKLELIPVVYDTDYCLLQNLEAITAEAASVYYSEMDNPNAKQMAQERHKQAIRLLNGELNHYVGADQPAVGFSPFGSANLSKYRVGTLY